MNSAARTLQLDVGNSGAKWRCCVGDAIIDRGSFVWGDDVSTRAFLQCIDSLEIDVASVAAPDKDLELGELLEQRWGLQPWFAKTRAETAGLRNSYADPLRMGVDRWLAMLGARERYEGELCVVDAGSALTIDRVGADGQHLGGYIIPGPGLMERALLLDTDRVRFDESASYALTPGHSTAEAVRHGIALAQAGAVSMALSGIPDTTVTVVYCGGAGDTLMQLLGVREHWHPDLVFEGLGVLARDEGV